MPAEIVKLTSEQRARASDLHLEMARADDLEPYAFELIALRDESEQRKKRAEFQKRVGDADQAVRDAEKPR